MINVVSIVVSMVESDKTRFKPLDDMRDYSLWRIHVYAATSANETEKVFMLKTDDGNGSSLHDPEIEGTLEQCQQASNIIVSALGDHAL